MLENKVQIRFVGVDVDELQTRTILLISNHVNVLSKRLVEYRPFSQLTSAKLERKDFYPNNVLMLDFLKKFDFPNCSTIYA
jgi:hypothetical protein